MREADGVAPERSHEVETRGIRVWQGQEGQIAAIGQHGHPHAVDGQRCAPVADVTEDEARVPRLDECIRRGVLHVNAKGSLDEGHRGERDTTWQRRRGRGSAPGRAGGERYEKRDTGGASRDTVRRHMGKLTALPDTGEVVIVCCVSPAFLYSAHPNGGAATAGASTVTPLPPETSYSVSPSALDHLPHFVTTPNPPASSTPRGDIIVHVLGRTDVGRTREHNEDAFLVADLSTGTVSDQAEAVTYPLGPRGALFMVADGLGGAAAGEIASGMAVDVVLQEMRRTWVSAAGTDPDTFAHALKKACEAANARIYEYAMKNPDHRGLGTTATIAGLLGNTLYLVQVGDSRAYIVRAGVAQQITKDQSLMQRLIEAGELTPEEAEQSERRNIILQALGPEPVVKIDLTHQPVRRGDLLVLCTDGLSGQVRKDEIASIAAQERDLTAAGQALIDRANENGGPDNITVVLAKVMGLG
ncbi:MAG TPA: Stp1/IreP family PP2C-type Ser/Thr phosphatase [Gemmatimonadaceae bacterium]|nr:Stp1/IreP family PP2C-type Ser/Thr phosphatase [Gemmatimonadaceae bacterium]